MPRLLVHVEGQTEEDFVNEILRNHLEKHGYYPVGARIMGNSRIRRKRGGIRPWPTVERGIVNHLREDSKCIVTTMVDFYGLPSKGPGAWPGRARTRGERVQAKAEQVQNAMLDSVSRSMGGGFDKRRFVPFVVMHEFEGLLFSDCLAFGNAVGRPDVVQAMQEIRDGFETPEHINDSIDTAPSKRISEIVHGYEKPLFGTLAVLEIELQRIRLECPHFDRWIRRLEVLGSQQTLA